MTQNDDRRKIKIKIGRQSIANELEGVINVAQFDADDKLGKSRELQNGLSKLEMLSSS